MHPLPHMSHLFNFVYIEIELFKQFLPTRDQFMFGLHAFAYVVSEVSLNCRYIRIPNIGSGDDSNDASCVHWLPRYYQNRDHTLCIPTVKLFRSYVCLWCGAFRQKRKRNIYSFSLVGFIIPLPSDIVVPWIVSDTCGMRNSSVYNWNRLHVSVKFIGKLMELGYRISKIEFALTSKLLFFVNCFWQMEHSKLPHSI